MSYYFEDETIEAQPIPQKRKYYFEDIAEPKSQQYDSTDYGYNKEVPQEHIYNKLEEETSGEIPEKKFDIKKTIVEDIFPKVTTTAKKAYAILDALPRGLSHGLTRDIPALIAGPLEFTGIAPETGKSIKEWVKKQYESEPEREGLEKWIYEGARIFGPSLIPYGTIQTGTRTLLELTSLVNAAKTAEMAGNVAKATELWSKANKIANTAAAGGTGVLFGLSQAQQTRDIALQKAEELEKMGDIEGAKEMRDKAYGITPYITGAIEAAGEALGTKYLGKMLGIEEGKLIKPTLLNYLKTLGVEVGTEVGQQLGEAGVEKLSGIRPEAELFKEAKEVVMPTIVMTSLAAGSAKAINRLQDKIEDIKARQKDVGLTDTEIKPIPVIPKDMLHPEVKETEIQPIPSTTEEIERPILEETVIKSIPKIKDTIENIELNEKINTKAHEAATSPINVLPEPTEEQKEAGNYKKGHISLHGLDISIENPKGSIRSGIDEEGEKWEAELKSHYGYIKGTKGKDKNHIDVFIGEHPESKNVYVVNQINPKTGKFDEHKVMLGYQTEDDARIGYLENYKPDWGGLGSITPMSIDEFKTWLKEGDTTKPTSSIEKVEKYNISNIRKAIIENRMAGREPFEGISKDALDYLIEHTRKSRGIHEINITPERRKELENYVVNDIDNELLTDKVIAGENIKEEIKDGLKQNKSIEVLSNNIRELLISKLAENKTLTNSEKLKVEKNLNKQISDAYEEYITEKNIAKRKPKEKMVVEKPPKIKEKAYLDKEGNVIWHKWLKQKNGYLTGDFYREEVFGKGGAVESNPLLKFMPRKPSPDKQSYGFDQLAEMAHAEGLIPNAEPETLLNAMKQKRYKPSYKKEETIKEELDKKQGQNTIEIRPEQYKKGDQFLIQNPKTGELEVYTHKGFDKKTGDIIIENDIKHKLDIGDTIYVAKILKKEEEFLKPPEVKEKPKKPAEQELPLKAEKTALEGMIPTIETPVTELEKAKEEAEARKAEEEMKEKQIKLPEEEAIKSPSVQIADWVVNQLENGNKFTKVELSKQGDIAFGGKKSEGKYNWKDLFDALEMGVNKYIMKKFNRTIMLNDITEHAQKTVDEIRSKVLDKIPSQQGIRSQEQDKFQQFSTPPDLAYVMAWAANITPKDVVLEPSAGLGGLAIYADIAGAKTIVNELSKRRHELLKEMGFDKVFNENAEQLHNILPDDIKPSVILMNPPFSATAGRIPSQKLSKNVITHLEQALKRLNPNGRLVALIGKSKFGDSKTIKDWFNNIQKEYNVKAIIDISGKGYSKYGTTYDARIIVIDKTGETKNNIIKESVNDFKDAIASLKEVRVNRYDEQAINRQIGEVETETPKQVVREAAERVGGEARPELPERVPANAVRTETRAESYEESEQRGGGPGFRGPGREISTQRGQGRGAELPGERLGGGRSTGREGLGRPESTGRSEETAGRVIPESEVRSTITPPVSVKAIEGEKRFKEELTDSLYEEYRPQRLKIEGAVKHPTKLVQSAAMASVQPPYPTYKPNLPQDIITSGKLSEAQLEAVVYAGQAHEQFLPNGARKGFFIGDGTGVGKGREISGILIDNFNRGRTKALWISESAKLINDAIRDFSDIGGDTNLIFALSNFKINADINKDKGIMFTTYSTLKSGLIYTNDGKVKIKENTKKCRLEQIVKWLGKDFDGVIVFDESHNMRNAINTQKGRGKIKASLAGLVGIDLQKGLPNARIVYASATGAIEVENLAYADRLGLWGENTAFANMQDFVSKIKNGGIAAMEVIARDMKATGVYISRSLSYEDVKYERLLHTLSEEQKEIYNTLAKSWQIVLVNLEKALKITGQNRNGDAKANARSKFWGSHQRFFNQVITSMQMPTVIKDIRNILDEGKSAVLQIVSTNEAIQNKKLAELGEDQYIEDLDLTPRENLMQYIENSFPVQQYEEYMDNKGNVISRPVLDANGNPVINKEAVEMREKLLDKLGAIKVPAGPLEIILDTFGTENVAEVTGRTRRVVYHTDASGNKKRVVESWSPTKSLKDADAFLNGDKRILIFSYAGGTGRSFHADITKKNQQQRVHYLIQAGWRADKAVQGFGRSHRTNQASAPIYKLVTTDLRGQSRFISSIARRLDQLGALTKGQRQASGQGLFTAMDNLESVYANDAKYKFFMDLYLGELENIGLDFDTVKGLLGLTKIRDKNGNLNFNEIPSIEKFLNRILSLTIDMQNKVFDAFYERLQQNIEAAIASGNLDMGLENYRANKLKVVGEKTIYIHPDTGAETKYVEIEASHKSKFLKYEDVIKLKNFHGFYMNTQSKQIWAVQKWGTKTDERGHVKLMFMLRNPLAHRFQAIDEYKFYSHYDENWGNKSEENIRKWWEQKIADSPQYRTEKINLITGAILPIWDRLPGEFVKVYRMQTDDGRRLIGRLIPNKYLEQTLKNFNINTNLNITPSDIVRYVMQEGAIVRLANGWRIKQSKVQGEKRIELRGDNLFSHNDELLKQGLYTERINYETRYFIPTGENSIKVIENLISNKPVAEVLTDEGDISLSLSTGEQIRYKIDESQLREILREIYRIIAPGSRISMKEFISFMDKNQKAFKQAFARWGLGDISSKIAIKGLHRVVTINGKYFASLIEVSLKYLDIIITLFHEAFHSVQDLLLSYKEKIILEKAYPEQNGIASKERQAIAFADYAIKRRQGMKLSVRTIFAKINDFFIKLGNALRGLGYTSPTDIFERAYTGEFRRRAIKEGLTLKSVRPSLSLAIQDYRSNPFILLKKAISTKSDIGIVDSDMNKIERLLWNPWWLSKKYPKLADFIEIQLERMQKRSELFVEFLKSPTKIRKDKTHEFLKLTKSEREALEPIMIYSDAQNKILTHEELTSKDKMEEIKDWFKTTLKEQVSLNPLTEKQIIAYYSWNSSMKKAWGMRMEHAKKMLFLPYENAPWINFLKDLYDEKVKIDDLKNNLDKEEYNELKRAYENISTDISILKKLRSEMGKQKYYVPRNREWGRYVIRAYNTEGKLIHSERTKASLLDSIERAEAAQIRDALKKEYPDGKIKVSLEKPIPEYIYQELSNIAIERFIQKALEKVKSGENIKASDLEIIKDALYNELSDELKARGWSKHMIHRITKQGQVIAGYQTRNLHDVYVNYMNGMVGSMTKQEAAIHFMRRLSNIDINNEAELYNYALNYTKDMLRNTTDLDRLSGKMSSIAFIWYLAGNLRMIPVQLTQNFVTGIPVLSRETKGARYKYMKAMKDVALGKLTDQEQNVLQKAYTDAILHAQYINEIIGRVKGTNFGRIMGRALNILAYPFARAEVYNRKAAFLAMYRVAKNELKMSDDDAFKKARDFVYDTHFLYGKANLPEWARGASTPSAAARVAYTFRSFTHNYILSMVHNSKSKEGKIMLGVFGRSLAYLFLLGGLTALPFLDDMLDILERLSGIPFRSQIRNSLKRTGGEILEIVGMSGIPGLLGFDLSGSLKIGLPRPSLEGLDTTVFGVYGGLANKFNKAIDSFSIGEWARGIETMSPSFIENIMRAYREATEGATTAWGKVIFDEKGRPMKLTTYEAIGRAAGLKPERLSSISMETRTLMNIQEHYEQEREKLYNRYAVADTAKERFEVIKEIKKYNNEIKKYHGIVPKITRQSLIKSIKKRKLANEKNLKWSTLNE